MKAPSLFERIKESKLPALINIAMLSTSRVRRPLHLNLQENVTPFDRGNHQDCALYESFDFSKEYKYLCEVELRDYGISDDHAGPDDEHIRDLGDYKRSELSYEISEVNEKNRVIKLTGSLYGDIMEISARGNWGAVFDIAGITVKDAGELTIFQELLIEAYSLEGQGNLKLALFTYFSAFESLVASTLENYRVTIPVELHYALEHLSLDQKVRVTARTLQFPHLDLESIPLWAALMEPLSTVKSIRNKIAHAKEKVEVTQEEVDQCFLCISIFHSFIKYKDQDIDQVRKRLYPKNALPADFGHRIYN